MYGEEDGKWSTAAKAAKRSDVFAGDLEGLLALIHGAHDLPLGGRRVATKMPTTRSVKFTHNYKKWAQDIKEDPRLFAEFLLDVEGWLNEQREAIKLMQEKSAKGGPAKAGVTRIEYYKREGKPAERLWIWQWDYGDHKGNVLVQKYGEVTMPWGLVVTDWFTVNEAAEVNGLELKFRCYCRPPTRMVIALPWGAR